MAKKKKLPADTNKRAKSVVELATQDKETISQDEAKTAAQQLGRLGGLKGGKARAKSLSAKRRKEIAQKAAAVRWGHKSN